MLNRIAFVLVGLLACSSAWSEASNPFQRDHAFDAGSPVVVESLSPIQVDNLLVLGKVWGFLKYHHPRVTAGELHWDYELLRVLPQVIAAEERAAAQGVMVRWVESLGPIPPCDPCLVPMPADVHLQAPLGWLHDERLLGSTLSRQLLYILDHRSAKAGQFYVTLAEAAKFPFFINEQPYAAVKWPDAGYQLLAAFRLWNAVEYWSPYRDLVGEDRDAMLRALIPRFALARDFSSYRLALMAMIAGLHDSHANLWSSEEAIPPAGRCWVPMHVRRIEGRWIVAAAAREGAAQTGGLAVGDEILSLDGRPLPELVDQWAATTGGSTQASLWRDVAHRVTRGDCVPLRMMVRRDGKDMTVQSPRVERLRDGEFEARDRPGPAFQVLAGDVAYLKLSAVKADDLPQQMRTAATTRGLVVDIRNYPAEFVPFALGQLLTGSRRPFVRFTHAVLAHPGMTVWSEPLELVPAQPRFAGKVAVLVDETSQSQAEYTAMALRAAGARIFGVATAGADGNISHLVFPGGLFTAISGLGVFYPDKTPTQRIGIVPDEVVEPTIQGIRQRRDETLEAALRWLQD
ncbi:S41 family peptidase [Piscinibacter terrae]|uniref:Tail specific protease domain-containing protein n=1 Tax=Piscinibacter terrae TaxID=2496871 RepID=A0A3N7K2B6_9BURK|nr:S41 family peptidase [Albitalea terrae]RQP25075.1 hypothetical protein DZC73_09480 [Albitalea terrae]